MQKNFIGIYCTGNGLSAHFKTTKEKRLEIVSMKTSAGNKSIAIYDYSDSLYLYLNSDSVEVIKLTKISDEAIIIN